ncbi:hypothetical protein [Streptomyces silvensis]|nr:hypothetical protein [Streptomyces silvensis]
MSRLPSLDDYDVQGVRPDEAAFWGGDVRWSVEERSDEAVPLEFLRDVA